MSELLQIYRETPADEPLIWLAGPGGGMLCSGVTEEDPEVFWALPAGLPAPAQSPHPRRGWPGFRSGLVALLSYDRLARPDDPGTAPHRVFRVRQTRILEEGVSAVRSADVSAGVRLIPQHDFDHYTAMVRTALADICSGRYYQINLLRYFLMGEVGAGSVLRSMLSRLPGFGGPHAALIRAPGVEVVSFSPERFFRTAGSDGRVLMETCPVKGTVARDPDPVRDRENAAWLLRSDKNLAELHMIVDLMRNDLMQVCQDVRVEVPHEIQSFANVHHLVAHVTGRVRSDVLMGEVLKALGPGGSVTGAPKREVMSAIRAYEGRERGYFMGNIVIADDRGFVDSSILIRTAVRTHQSHYEFAAGSGIVIHSDPVSEYEEILAKCRIVSG